MSKRALSLQAHPDDAEFACAGTLALLAGKGWEIHIATMTPGDGGTKEYSREEISKIRTAEAAKSAAILDGQYHCLWCDDVFILYDRPTLLRAMMLVRQIQPTLVFAPSPSDYMQDHEITSKIAQTACFTAGVVNVDTGEAKAFEPVPYLYYCDPAGGIDILGNEIKPTTLVNISSIMETKEKMLSCHQSQQDWLKKHHDIEYLDAMKARAAKRGSEIGAAFAEGFRQHLGSAFPTDNLLKTELGKSVHVK
ncbi:MAG: PIG-L family deacetylase [Planctomycetes bacterium]|nr:PIG-L family deacetylase [Planctomycetota bacterium]